MRMNKMELFFRIVISGMLLCLPLLHAGDPQDSVDESNSLLRPLI
jgi:hypothetical protein